MKPNTNPYLIGVIAGLAAAILMAASAYAPFLSFLLLCAAFTAIFIAGLGFGLTSSLVAIATAAAANAILYGSPASLFFTALPLLPGAAMAYLANLARPAEEIGGPDTAMAWFPLSDVLLAGAVLTAIATVIMLSLHPNMAELYAAVAEAATKMMAEMTPGTPVTPELSAQMATLLKVLWPLVQSMQMLLALFAGFYFATRILTAAGRSLRPREDMRTSLRMNRLAIAVFMAGIVLMFAGPIPAMIGGSFTGAVAGGFLLSGFAIIHNALRAKPWATPALVLIYLATLLVPVFGVAIILAGGLANPRRAIALTPNKPTPANQP